MYNKYCIFKLEVIVVKRKITENLERWKAREPNMPFMLIGARQVGKTYILDEFCRKNFAHYVYINLEKEKGIMKIFEKTLDPEKIIAEIELIQDKTIIPEETVIFFDEIQVSEKAIASLKYFNESENKFNIVCAGSLLGVALNRFESSYPVGKVRRGYMHPMDFEEFLWAIDQEKLANKINDCFISNTAMFEGTHEKTIEIYKEYLFVGGMPASILHHISNDRRLNRYNREIKRDIISDYIADMSKYTTNSESIKIKKIYESIPKQLGKSDYKFVYKLVTEGAKKARYETAIDWLENSNLINKCTLVDSPRIPLKVYEKNSFFKIYLNDVGLLTELAEVSLYNILSDEINIFKEMLTENYVAQAFVSNGNRLNYWKSSNKAEIDFLVNIKGEIIPVEVKAARNTKSKSLSVYVQKYSPKYSIKISSKNFGLVNKIKSVPLYATYLVK